jgi:phosphohistidine phosphatase
MKTVYLVRHAKSDWSTPGLSDFNRPLNKRGKQNAPLMGKKLREKGILPDIVISSPAVRAITTARAIAQEIGYSPDAILTEKAIYEASSSTLATIIQQQDNARHSLMLVGHNPGFTELASRLSAFPADNIPTCGIVGIQWENDSWSEVVQRKGKLLFFYYPKQFT